VPSADAVICGDVVYNNVHMMMYEADETKREAWIASIDVAAALNPKIVVAGHKSVGAADLPENLAASQRYLRDFTTLAKKGGTVEDLVHGRSRACSARAHHRGGSWIRQARRSARPQITMAAGS
jgi:glyoxylase-like metal-dependent hydrolase (beta-lactamase superfamily II)